MISVIMGMVTMLCSLLKDTVKNSESKAKLKSAMFKIYGVIVALYPEFGNAQLKAEKTGRKYLGLS